jgi:excisionase family DNA binding protein
VRTTSKNILAVPAVEVSIDPSQAAFNLEQLAVYLGLSLWQSRSLVWSGKVPALKVGRNYIVRRTDADNFIAGAAAPMPCDSTWMQKRDKSAAALEGFRKK